MSLQSAIEFINRAHLDAELSNSASEVISNNCSEADKYRSIISIANDMGYEFTLEEWKEALLLPSSEESYEDELLNVAGGLKEPDRPQLYCKGLGVDM